MTKYEKIIQNPDAVVKEIIAAKGDLNGSKTRIKKSFCTWARNIYIPRLRWLENALHAVHELEVNVNTKRK
jgi:hypothetical protein